MSNLKPSALVTHRSHLLLPLGAAAALVCSLLLLPVLYLAWRSVSAGGDLFFEIFSHRVAEIWLRSLFLAGLVSVLSVLLGILAAWLTTSTDLPARRLWTILLALPLVIPSYVAAFAWIASLGPAGVIRNFLALYGLDFLPGIYSLFGAVLCLTFLCYPYVFLTVRAGLLTMDSRLVEVARTLGQDRFRAFWKVVLPIIRPAILAGVLLVALYSLSDFGAVSLLQFDSFTRAIYVQYRASFDRSAAAWLSILLVIKTVLLLVAARSLTSDSGRRSGRSTNRVQLIPLGAWTGPALSFCGLIALISLGMPIGMTLMWFWKASLAGLDWSGLASIAANSVYVSTLAGTATTILAFPIAFLRTHRPGRLSRQMESLSYIGYALPGIVIALALVFFGARHVPWLYQSTPLLILAYLIRFLPQAVGAERAALEQINPRTEEAALSLGLSPYLVFLKVVLPLVRPGLFTAFALVFLTTMKELPATLLLSPIGLETLATRIWTATSEGFFAEAALPVLLLILVSAASISFVLQSRRELKGETL